MLSGRRVRSAGSGSCSSFAEVALGGQDGGENGEFTLYYGARDPLLNYCVIVILSVLRSQPLCHPGLGTWWGPVDYSHEHVHWFASILDVFAAFSKRSVKINLQYSIIGKYIHPDLFFLFSPSSASSSHPFAPRFRDAGLRVHEAYSSSTRRFPPHMSECIHAPSTSTPCHRHRSLLAVD